MATIQDAINGAAPGDVVTIPAGVYDVSNLVLPSNITLQANGNATIVGNLILSGSNDTVKGFSFTGGTVDLGHSDGATVADCVFTGGQTSIKFDGATGAHITNNSFSNVAGNVIDGWGLDQSTISGNQFSNCWQPINLDFNNDPTHGRDIVIAQNHFTGTQRMDIEVGPVSAYTSNMVVRDNWSENMNNAGPDGSWNTDVAYSIVQTNGVNTLITGNYAKGPENSGIGIELAGSGEVTGNHIEGFNYGAIVYGSGFNVHDNALVDTPIDTVLNYSGGSGTIQNNTTDPTAFMPADPATVAPPADAAPSAPTAAGDPPPVDPSTTDPTSGPTPSLDPSGVGQSANSTGADATSSQQNDPPAQSPDQSVGAPGTDPTSNDPQTGGTTTSQDSQTTSQQNDPSAQSPDQNVGAPGTDPTSNDPQTGGTTPSQDPQTTQAGDHASVGFQGTVEQDAALAASDAATLASDYQAGLDQHQAKSMNFNLDATAVLDQNSNALRDQAIVDLQAGNPQLKVSFTVASQADGLDAGTLSMLQGAKNDGVQIDAVKIVLHDSGQDSLNAASTAQQEVAALGLTAKFAVASGFDGNGTAISHSKFSDLQILLDHSASTNLGQDHATADGGVNAQQPFEFAGLSHHVDHIA